jgi:(p)ppGpp synthase/HD superfamily hydrolase
MKRVEVLSRAIGSAALSHRDADHIRCLLLTVEDFDWRALLVRCVSNLNEIKAIRKRTAQTVRAAREGLLVYGPLASMLGLTELKTKIEDLAFRFLYPRQHKAADSIFGSAEGSIEAASSFLTCHVQALLRSDEFLQEHVEHLLVSSRVKERYSFWKKLIRKKAELIGQSSLQKLESDGTQRRRWNRSLIDQVPDAVALRVVLRSKRSGVELSEATQAKEKLLCYYVQEKIRARWPVWDTRCTKDYIRSPKANSYQSLHYTSSIMFGNDDLPFEVQVRSYDMHLAAEYGSASHSIYKIQAPSNLTSRLMCPSLPQPRPSSMTHGYLECLEGTRAAVVGKNTFIFVSIPQNQSNFIMSIPQNCRVQDAIAVLPVTSSESFVFVNGRKAQLDDKMQNGDALLVLETEDSTEQGKHEPVV